MCKICHQKLGEDDHYQGCHRNCWLAVHEIVDEAKPQAAGEGFGGKGKQGVGQGKRRR